MGKSDEALTVCLDAKELLYKDDSSLMDDLTLSTLQIVLQRLDHLDLATSCYAHACGKFHNNLELMMGLFNCYVREYSFVKQQQTAIKMYKLAGEERFLLWAVCSIQLHVLPRLCLMILKSQEDVNTANSLKIFVIAPRLKLSRRKKGSGLETHNVLLSQETSGGKRISVNDLAAVFGPEDGGLDPLESQGVVDLLNRELTRLLKLNPREFWREVASDASLHDFLDSFLKFRSRWYDFLKAAALSLRKFPQCNSSWNDEYIRQFSNVNINVAVQTENGLYVPVVEDADKKGWSTIGEEVRFLAKKAKENSLKPEDYEVGTFTVSNLGGHFGIKQFCAVINPPQAALSNRIR